MKTDKRVFFSVVLMLNLMLVSCALGRNLRDAATSNPTGSSAPATMPTLIVAPTTVSSNQASATQSAPMVQSQSTSSDDLDAISQDVQQLSEPDVSVDSIPTPLSGDSLNDLNGLDQQEQDMQQVLESLK
jgi:hypothetical protein